MINTLAMWTPGLPEMLVIGVVLLLLFGRRLPDVARSLGKSITEFKKGIRDVSDDVDHHARIDSSSVSRIENRNESSAPRGESASPSRPQAESHGPATANDKN